LPSFGQKSLSPESGKHGETEIERSRGELQAEDIKQGYVTKD
jgi:hypothetical protein